MNEELLKAAKDKVTKIFSEEVESIYTYHNLIHTLKVVSAATTLANPSQLSDEEKEMLLLAAYFHDTGFVQGQENHEMRSAKMADEWLESQNYPVEKREIIAGIISSTRREAIPESEFGKLLKDADLSASDIDEVLLVGGQTRSLKVAQTVKLPSAKNIKGFR